MKIDQAYFSGFGRLISHEVQFKNGLNLLQADNESGKSTLIHGIIALLYGLKREDLQIRKEVAWYHQYLPWHSQSYGGNISYSIHNHTYKLLRNLLLTEESEQLINISEHLDITVQFAMDRRKERRFLESQLKLSREEFIRIALIEPGLLPEGDLSLAEKLRQLFHNGDDLAVLPAIARLDKRLAEIGKRKGESTELGRDLLLHERLSQEVLHLKKATDEYLVAKTKIVKAEAELVEMGKQIKEEQVKLTGFQRLQDSHKQLAELEAEFTLNQRYLDQHERLQSRKQELTAAQPENSRPNYVIVSLLLCCLLLSVALSRWRTCLTLIIVIAGYVWWSTQQRHPGADRKGMLEELAISLAEYPAASITRYNSRQQELCAQMDKLLVAEDRDRESNQHNIKCTEERLAKYRAEYSDTKSLIDRLLGVISSLGPLIQLLSLRETELAGVAERIKIYKKESQELELTKEYLLKVSLESRVGIAPDLIAHLSDWLSRVTQGRYKQVILEEKADFTFLVFSTEKNSYIPLKLLSKGAIDQFVFALRLSLLQIFAKHMKLYLPLILDDAFVHFDDDRLRETLLALSEFSCYHQVILCTCQKREQAIFRDLSIDFNLL